MNIHPGEVFSNVKLIADPVSRSAGPLLRYDPGYHFSHFTVLLLLYDFTWRCFLPLISSANELKMSHNPARVANPEVVAIRLSSNVEYRCTGGLIDTDQVGLQGCTHARSHRPGDIKANRAGRWTMENTFNGRFLVNIKRKGKPSKWVTLNSLRTLKMNR